MKPYTVLLALGIVGLLPTRLLSQGGVPCYHAKWCLATACTNVAPGPVPGYFDDFCGNGPVFGNECIVVWSHQKASTNGDYRAVPARVVCRGGVPNPYVSDRCADRWAGTTPLGGCNVVVGACGDTGVVVGC